MDPVLVTVNIPDFVGDDLFPRNDIQNLFTANGRTNEAESFTTFSVTQVVNGDLLTLLSDVVAKVQYYAGKDDDKADSIILNPGAKLLIEGWLTKLDIETISAVICSLLGASIAIDQIKKLNNVKLGCALLVSVSLKENLYILKASLSIDFQTIKDGSFTFPVSTISVPLTLPIFDISK